MWLTASTSTVVDFFTNTGSDSPAYAIVIDPHAVYDSSTNKTWFTWEAFNGTYRVTQVTVYDHAALTWSSIYNVGGTELVDDPHGNPCVIRDAGGYWHSFFGGHVTPIQHFITTTPDDPSAWAAQPVVPTDAFNNLGQGGTYPHVVLVGSTLHLFYRWGSISQVAIIKSTSITNGVVVWGTPGSILDFSDGGGDGRAEPAGFGVSGTNLHFVVNRAPTSDAYRRGVYKVVYNTITGAISNLSGSVTIAAGSLPANLATMDASFLIEDSGGTNLAPYWAPDFCFDSSGGQHFLYVSSADGVICTIKYFNYIAGVQSSPVDVATVSVFSQGALIALAAGAMAIVWNEYSDGSVYRAVRPSGGPIGASTLVRAGDASFPSGPPERVRNSTTHQFLWFETNLLTPTGTCKGYCYGDNGYLQRSSFAAWPPGVAAAATTTFNDADKTFSSLHVASNNLIIASYAANDLSIRSTTSKSSGKVHVEFTILLTRGSSGLAVGLASGSHSLANYLGQDTTSIGFWCTGGTSQLYFNGGTTAMSFSVRTFEVLAMEADFGALKLWYKNVTTGSDWNGNPTANPATGVGGIDISVLTGSPFFLCVNTEDYYNAVALNAGNLPWALTPSTGFGSW